MTKESAALARIRESIHENLFVEAGAGAGKTGALVERYVALVRAGRPPSRLVAITFTEKAAAELRERVRSALEQDTSGNQNVARALETLDAAPISTIHAFAADLVRVFAAELGVDPDFEVLDEIATARHVQQHWRDTLEQLGNEARARDVFGRALRLGLTPANMERLATELWPRADLALRLAEAGPAGGGSQWPDLAQMRRDLQALDIGKRPRDDKLALRLARLLSLVEELERADAGEREAALARGGLHELTFPLHGKSAWGRDLKRAKDTGDAISAPLRELLSGLRREALAGLLPYIARAVVGDLAARSAAGTLTFDDLIVLARDAAARLPAARARLQARFDQVLIDEFQDTDPIQWEIASAFAEVGDGSLRTGRLFVVGDPKQSIYRFRNADMAVYARARERLIEDQPPVTLDESWRSSPNLVQWTNSVFARVFGAATDRAVSPPFSALEAIRDDAPAGPAVSYFGEADGTTPMADIRRREAAAVVGACQAVAGHWEVTRRGVDDCLITERAALRDIAILMPSRALLPELERALESAGVAAKVESGSLVFQTQEVRDLINVLTAIADPGDAIAAVAALRSPAFACSDVELAEHRLAGGSFNSLAPGLPAGPVTAALERLAALHRGAATGGIADLVQSVLSETGAVASAIIDRGDRDAFRRARFVLEQARAFEAGGPQPLRAFVEWLEQRAGAAIVDHEGTLLEDDEDAVRILTVHAAKGLEFPVVIMAGFGSAPPYPEFVYGKLAIGEVAVTIGSKERGRFTFGPIESVETLERAHAEAEQKRLLYVAATRARDHLVLSRYMKNDQRCGVALLFGVAGAAEGAELLKLAELPAAGHVSRIGSLDVDAPAGDDPAELLVERTAAIAAAPRLLVTSATALRSQNARLETKPDRGDDSEPWSRGRAGTRLGRAVHAVIQSAPLDATSDELWAFARAQAVAEAIPGAADEIVALATAAMRSAAMGRARRATRLLREVPFAAGLRGTLVEGFADLVFQDGDGLEIVDWKTDRIPATAVLSRMDDYRLQAGLYVLGLEAATGQQVRRVTYVFLSPGIEQEMEDVAALRLVAEDALASVATPSP